VSEDNLYREFILDHVRSPRNHGRIEGADISHEEHNPLCGDMVGMDFKVQAGVIENAAFYGRGCVISQASASLMTERLKGMSLEEARTISKEDVLDELGIQISPARVKCALLPLKVVKVGAYGLANYDPEEDEEQA
jgi:nitrogen fixation protein NifU and related proteins